MSMINNYLSLLILIYSESYFYSAKRKDCFLNYDEILSYK